MSITTAALVARPSTHRHPPQESSIRFAYDGWKTERLPDFGLQSGARVTGKFARCRFCRLNERQRFPCTLHFCLQVFELCFQLWLPHEQCLELDTLHVGALARDDLHGQIKEPFVIH